MKNDNYSWQLNMKENTNNAPQPVSELADSCIIALVLKNTELAEIMEEIN